MQDIADLADRAPDVVRRFAYRVAEGRGVAGRFADAVRFRFSADEIPSVPEISEAPVRLVIGPADSAGQAFGWARAAERGLPGVTALSVREVGADPFRLDVDLRVPVAVYQRSTTWHRAFEDFLRGQTHVVWESGLPLLGRRYRSVADERQILARAGVTGALLFHGSDIRPPARHAAQSEWSPFHTETGRVRALEDGAVRNAALARSFPGPVFVSTPDLLQWLPDSTWCPVVVDPAMWSGRAPSRRAGRMPVVAHAPSQAWLKGTERIEPILRRLESEGLIEYRRIVGVPHASMPDFYAGADIVLDQFVLGIYGVAACEAMAAGCLVMSHVDAFTRAAVRERTALDLPIHETTVETLETELRLVVGDPAAFDRERAAGPAFVDAVHDGRRSAEALAPFLGLTG